jgi:hypothetical protein
VNPLLIELSLLHRFRPIRQLIPEAKWLWLTKKMMDGEAALAFLNISLTALSDSPTYLLSNYESAPNHVQQQWTYLWTFDCNEVQATLGS